MGSVEHYWGQRAAASISMEQGDSFHSRRQNNEVPHCYSARLNCGYFNCTFFVFFAEVLTKNSFQTVSLELGEPEDGFSGSSLSQLPREAGYTPDGSEQPTTTTVKSTFLIPASKRTSLHLGRCQNFLCAAPRVATAPPSAACVCRPVEYSYTQ